MGRGHLEIIPEQESKQCRSAKIDAKAGRYIRQRQCAWRFCDCAYHLCGSYGGAYGCAKGEETKEDQSQGPALSRISLQGRV